MYAAYVIPYVRTKGIHMKRKYIYKLIRALTSDEFETNRAEEEEEEDDGADEKRLPNILMWSKRRQNRMISHQRESCSVSISQKISLNNLPKWKIIVIIIIIIISRTKERKKERKWRERNWRRTYSNSRLLLRNSNHIKTIGIYYMQQKMA